jgi:retron-type reverse transcriptase
MEKVDCKIEILKISVKVYSIRHLIKKWSNKLSLNFSRFDWAYINKIGSKNRVQNFWFKVVRYLSVFDFVSFHGIKAEVVARQKKLIELAKLNGIYDLTVLDEQQILLRSPLFRGYVAKILGIGREKFFKKLLEFLKIQLDHPNSYRVTKAKKVWIVRFGKNKRWPVGLSTIKDRALQYLINLVLQPLVELHSDPNSYGFRPYRNCKMAIAAVRVQFKVMNLYQIKKVIDPECNQKNVRLAAYLKANQDKYVLDADVKGFFNNVSHKWFLDKLCLHPNFKKFIDQWLKVKTLYEGMFIDPLSGTFRGGVILPTLVNFMLNGLEKTVVESMYYLTKVINKKISVKTVDKKISRRALSVTLVRYVDDFVVITRSPNIFKKYIISAINKFLAERGLWLSPEKTKLFKLSQSGTCLDFLGYTFKYKTNRYLKKTIAVYPKRDCVVAFIKELKYRFIKGQNSSAIELITQLNPLIKRWAGYYNLDNSVHYRRVVREVLYKLAWKWMSKKHPKLSKTVLGDQYFLKKKRFSVESVLDKNLNTNSAKLKRQNWILYSQGNQDLKQIKGKKRVVSLLSPVSLFPIVNTVKYLLPVELRNINAFDKKIRKVIMFNLKLVFINFPKTPNLKEKLYQLQKGRCFKCNIPMNFDCLYFGLVQINYINLSKKEENTFMMNNLVLNHFRCY